MKKVLFTFALTLLFALGASAQSYPTTVQVDPDYTTCHVERIPVIDTTIDTVLGDTFDTIPGFSNYIAVADTGWRFDHWVMVLPYLDTAVAYDTVYSYTLLLGDDLDDEFWMDWPGIPDSTDESLGAPITITAYFTSDTNTVGIRTIHKGATFTVRYNPDSDMVTVADEIRWIQVYDMTGRLITRTTKPTINLRNQPDGTYVLLISNTNGQTGSTKIVKR
jgi:hypothetical protein